MRLIIVIYIAFFFKIVPIIGAENSENKTNKCSFDHRVRIIFWIKKGSYGTQIASLADNYYTIVDLGFTFKYSDVSYTRVKISTNGHVCLGGDDADTNMTIPGCDRITPPSPLQHTIVGSKLRFKSNSKGQWSIKHTNHLRHMFVIMRVVYKN